MLKLQEEFGIATATSQKVHRGLRAEGLIYTEPGMGSFVSKDLPERSAEGSGGA
ncbi:hypothetical protein SRIMR7_18575 [Streptomyces rimosus subsp. rimosus]|uniref:GntR family transcriptional regulator n=1 Tax=Streptomyces rimosus subsp. rimosus TaxID=132474 RepID=A0ABY3Z3S9_STRRM|nr:hypothetical protein SRIMR7_18575 [Streptomyces rimosus subsp. rimosus]